MPILLCKTEFLVLFDWSVTSDSGVFQLFKWWDGIAVHAVYKVRHAWHPRHGQLGFFSVPTLPRHGHGDIWGHLWGVDREVHISPRPYLLPLFLKQCARKIFLVSTTPPFSPNYSPLSLLPAPHIHIPPLISHFPLPLSAPPPPHL